MKKKLFVGGLSWDTDNDGLKEAFAEYGPVQEAVVITDRYSGRSRGFGFVTYNDPQDASSALEEMNGATLDGRTLNVDVAHDRRSRRDDHNSGYNNNSSYGW